MIGYFYGMTHSISGHDCWDDSNAPWKERGVELICDECGGDGRWYEDVHCERISEDEYNELSQEQRADYVMKYCPKCDGEGYYYE